MKKSNHKIIIVGGGNAGLSVASRLLKKNNNLAIKIIDPTSKHYYQPAWTLVGAGIFDITKTERNQADLIPKNAVWIKNAVTTFLPGHNKIVCADDKELFYDVLIVCPGIQLDWNKIKGLKETLGINNVSSNYDFHSAPYTWEIIKNLKSGTAVFTSPSSPIKCGGAPQKIMYLACDYWRKQGVLDKINVVFLTGGTLIFGVKEYAVTLDALVKKNNIDVRFGCNVESIDAGDKVLFYEQKDAAGNTIRHDLKFDMCHIVPPQSAPDFIKNSPLADVDNPYGYVEINKYTLQHSRFPNVFALGDCTNAPYSKTGAAIRKQAPVVVKNMLAYLKHSELIGKYNGYSACPIPTAYGKLMLAEFDYTNTPKMTFPFNQAKPNWLMWILKTKILPWLYWNMILKGRA
jgi:sulfide:quinone oxidoreductase